METFKLDIPDIRERFKKVLIFLAVLYVVVNGVAVLILLQLGHQHDLLLRLFPVLMASTILSGVLTLSSSRRIKIMETYLLVFDEAKVSRRVGSYPEVVLTYDEIEAIYQNPDGTYKIKGTNPKIFIHIPKQIDRKTELEKTLQQIKPFSEEPQFVQKKNRNVIFTLLSLAGSITFFVSSIKWLILASGIVLMGTLLVSFVLTVRHPLLNQATKNKAWFSLLLVLLVGFMMYKKLTVLH